MDMISYYKWVQLPIKKGQKKAHWVLVSRETGYVVLEIGFSQFSESYQDFWLRKKIKRAYERYDTKVFFNALQVY